jgi:hypothetical protein
MSRLVVAALAVVLLAAGCGGTDDPAHAPAARAQVQFLHDLYGGRLDAAYATLHPAYQRIVPRKRFIACTRATPLGRLGTVEVLYVKNDIVDVPESGAVPAKAVRVRLTSSDGRTTTFVNHEVEVGDGWRWVLNAPATRAYRAGRCPGG